MASQAFANYSNTVSNLRSTLQGAAQQEGQEKENDRKAFAAEMLSQASQFQKEKALEGAPAALTSIPGVKTIAKKVFNKDLTPLKTKATAAKDALKAAQDDEDEEGIKATEDLAGKAADTAAKTATKAAADSAVEDAQGAVDALPSAADLAATTAAKTGLLAEAQSSADAAEQALTVAHMTPIQGYDPAALQSLNDAQAAHDTAQGALSGAKTALSDAQSAEADLPGQTTAASDALAQATNEASTAAKAVNDAKEAENAAKDAADVAKVARVEKLAKGVKDTEEVAEGAAEEGHPISVLAGLAVAGITAWIGSRIQVHKAVAPPAPNISQEASFAATPGA